MFIHVSHESILPLYASPFLSSTSCMPCACITVRWQPACASRVPGQRQACIYRGGWPRIARTRSGLGPRAHDRLLSCCFQDVQGQHAAETPTATPSKPQSIAFDACARLVRAAHGWPEHSLQARFECKATSPPFEVRSRLATTAREYQPHVARPRRAGAMCVGRLGRTGVLQVCPTGR